MTPAEHDVLANVWSPWRTSLYPSGLKYGLERTGRSCCPNEARDSGLSGLVVRSCLTFLSLPWNAGWALLVAEAALAKKAATSCLYMRSTSTIEFRCARNASWPPTEDPSRESSGGRSSPSSFRSAPKPLFAWLMTGRRPLKRPCSSGASLPSSTSVGLSSRAAGRSWWTSGSVSAAKLLDAVSVSRDSSRKVGRTMNARRGPRCAAPSSEDRVGVPDQALELALALAQRLEDVARVARRTGSPRAPLGVEHPQHPVGLGRERLELADRGVEVGAAAPERDRRLLHPALERQPRRRVEGAEDLVELDRARRPGPSAQGPALRAAFGPVAGLAGRAARRRSRRAASSGAGSPGCCRGAARTWSRARASRRLARRRWVIDLTLPTETPEIRTSDSTASWVASLNGTLIR